MTARDGKSSAMIEVRDLTRQFGGTKALESLSFRVPEGSVCGFIGPNGAGKSTTMRILATLDLPTAGAAWVNGISVTDDPLAVRALIGYMPDYGGSYPNITASEYLDFFARSYKLPRAYREQRYASVVEFTELSALLDRPVDGMSKGQKQRLNLARALLPDPQVLILDEPAEGLDPRARLELRALLRLLSADLGKTVLISSHILSELDDLIDHAVIIDQGRLVFAGSRKQMAAGEHDGSDAEVLHDEDVQVWKLELQGDAEPVVKWLLTRQGVLKAKLEDDGIMIAARHSELPGPALLRELVVDRGVDVQQWQRGTRGLEDMFLDLTGRSW